MTLQQSMIKQCETLTEASRTGYYENPRTANSSEVAARLKIYYQTFSERLQRVHSQLVGTYL